MDFEGSTPGSEEPGDPRSQFSHKQGAFQDQAFQCRHQEVPGKLGGVGPLKQLTSGSHVPQSDAGLNFLLTSHQLVLTMPGGRHDSPHFTAEKTEAGVGVSTWHKITQPTSGRARI